MIVLAISVSMVLGFVLYFFVWRLMNQLAIQNVELVELNNLKNKFLGIAAHDLRNPLGVLKGYLSLILKGTIGKITDQQKDVLERMNQRSESMLALINDLLDISAIESGKMDLEKDRVNLASFLEEIRESNQLLAKPKSINLKLTLEPDLPDITIDRNRISQVMNNLISNGIKYSNQNTEILLSARSENKNIIISVADQGMGIPEDELFKLFADFSKTSVKPTAGEKSTGLGLAIVKRMVEAHGGHVWIDSSIGKGSTFSFSLPSNIKGNETD